MQILPPAVTRSSIYKKYAPVCLSVGFIEADIDTVATRLQTWRADIGWASDGVMRGHGIGVLDQIAPLRAAGFDIEALVSAGKWTAYFANDAIGGADAAPLGQLALFLATRVVHARMIADTFRKRGALSTGAYGVSTLCVYGAEQADWLNVVRSVESLNDGGRWRFTEIGEPLPFESTERYRTAKVKERLTPSVVLELLDKMQIAPFADAFYGPDGIALKWVGHESPRPRITYEEARSRAGIHDSGSHSTPA